MRKLAPLEDIDKRSFILKFSVYFRGLNGGPYVVTDYVDLMFPVGCPKVLTALHGRIASEVSNAVAVQ